MIPFVLVMGLLRLAFVSTYITAFTTTTSPSTLSPRSRYLSQNRNPGAYFQKRHSRIHYNRHCFTLHTSSTSGEDDDDEQIFDDIGYNVSSPPFPPASYHLARDESQLGFHFISFIDHFFEPYSQVARLIEPRFYARADQFSAPNASATNDDETCKICNPTIDDVAPPPSLYSPLANLLAWNRLPARIVVGTLAYFAFPIIVSSLASTILHEEVDTFSSLNTNTNGGGLVNQLLSKLVTPPMPVTPLPDIERLNLSTLVNFYLPGVSIVLATYCSMTVTILYDRIQRLQQTVALEATLLAHCFQVLLELFDKDQAKQYLITSAQCVADQVSTLVRDSRGKETMRIIYKDPYGGILRIVQKYHRRKKKISRSQEHDDDDDSVLVCVVRDCVKELFELRAKRLSDEAMALAPTHFDVMSFLSGLLLVGIALGTVATAQTDGVSTEVSRILFSALVVCYTTIYEMGYDLNRPFDGAYQLRRSGAATPLLQIKRTVSQHPVLKDVINFDPDADRHDLEEVPKVDRARKAEIWYN